MRHILIFLLSAALLYSCSNNNNYPELGLSKIENGRSKAISSHAKSARITLTNEGDKNVRSFYYQIDYTEADKLPDDAAYFCAQYRQEFPEKTGEDYLILDAEGQGHYIGTVLSVRSRSPYWFGEGDAKFYIDGEEEPSIWGTGTEDYFLCAWGLNQCIMPYFGCTYKSMDTEEDLGVKFTLYSWHMPDPVSQSILQHCPLMQSGFCQISISFLRERKKPADLLSG
jgi:hypothetical protein